MTLQPGSGRIQCREGNIEYQLHRPDRPRRFIPATTLVLLHEGLGSISMWGEFPEHLAHTTGYDVFVYSRLGYGKSDATTLPWQVDYMHVEGQKVLPQVLNNIQTQHFVLVGHSDGASIATIYAGDQPDPRLLGLVLIAPHFFTENISLKSIRGALEAYEQGDLRARLERYHGDNTDNAFYGWNGAWLNPEFEKWDITEFLPEIRVPVLLIQGKQDQYGTEAQLREAEKRCNGYVMTAVIDDCRHAPHLEREIETLNKVNGFLRQISKVDAS